MITIKDHKDTFLEDINLEVALKWVDDLSDEDGNFLTIERDGKEVIQFVNLEEYWMMDIPLDFGNIIMQNTMSLDDVKKSIALFFSGKSDAEISTIFKCEEMKGG